MQRSSPVLIILCAGILLVLCLVAYVWISVPSAPPVVLPNPNGFPRFLDSGKRIVGTPDDIATADADTLRRFLDANAVVLNASLEALQLECMVPIEYSAVYQQRVADDVGPLKNVARLLFADARLAELEGRPEEAVDKYAKVIRFSQQTSNGGLLIHLQSGIAYERLAWQALLKLAPSLSRGQKAALKERLAATNRAAIKIEDFMARERAVATAAHGRFMMFMMSRSSDAAVSAAYTRDLIMQMQTAREQVVKELSE